MNEGPISAKEVSGAGLDLLTELALSGFRSRHLGLCEECHHRLTRTETRSIQGHPSLIRHDLVLISS